jgi:hypothetical protein
MKTRVWLAAAALAATAGSTYAQSTTTRTDGTTAAGTSTTAARLPVIRRGGHEWAFIPGQGWVLADPGAPGGFRPQQVVPSARVVGTDPNGNAIDANGNVVVDPALAAALANTNPAFNGFGFDNTGAGAFPGFNGANSVDFTGAGDVTAVSPGTVFATPGTGGGFFFGPNFGGVFQVPQPTIQTATPIVNQVAGSMGWPRSRAPILGIDTPPARSNVAFTGARRSRQTSMRQAATAVTPKKATRNTEQLRVARRMQNLMEDHPLVSATVVVDTGDTVRVRMRSDGQSRTANIAANEVFVSRGNGEMVTADMTNAVLMRGQQVLVPDLSDTKTVRQAVAGSRQTTRRSTRSSK